MGCEASFELSVAIGMNLHCPARETTSGVRSAVGKFEDIQQNQVSLQRRMAPLYKRAVSEDPLDAKCVVRSASRRSRTAEESGFTLIAVATLSFG